jgi:hypothetical protein
MRSFILLVAIMVPAVGVAQTAKPLAFEVASVRPTLSAPNTPGSRRYTPGRVELVKVSLQEIVLTALNVDFRRLSAPGWLANVRFDIYVRSCIDRPVTILFPMPITMLRIGPSIASSVVSRAISDMPGNCFVSSSAASTSRILWPPLPTTSS